MPPTVVHGPPPRWDPVAPGVRVRHMIDAEGTALALYHIDPGTLCDLHEHDFPELGMVLAGQGVITFDVGEHRTEAGDSFYVPSGTRHGFRVPNDGSTVLMLNVAATGVPARKLPRARGVVPPLSLGTPPAGGRRSHRRRTTSASSLLGT